MGDLVNSVRNPSPALPCNAVVQKAIQDHVSELEPDISALNSYIHSNPELAYHEYKAHDAVCDLLETLGYKVTRHAYGLRTAFEVIAGTGGRLVNFNAEYDALPGIGHACGHNLICTAAVTAFLALAHVLERFGIEGRVQLLGTPAEEDGGGKIELLKAGAYESVHTSLMVHPMSDADYKDQGVVGTAGFASVASHTLRATYTGVSAHAGASPWEGVNALDALVAAYVNVSMLRQQIQPIERIHGAIIEAPRPSGNAIPALTRTEYTTRSTTVRGARALGAKVRRCMEAGAIATGCKLSVKEESGYSDLRINGSLCESFQQHMSASGLEVLKSQGFIAAATDQGDVSYALPALHAVIGIPVADGSNNHTPGFAKAAGSAAAYERTIVCGKAIAMTGWDIITKDGLYANVERDFEQDKMLR